MRKRILSVLLCLVMVTSLLPTAVFAEGEEGRNDGGTTVQVDDGKAVIIKDSTSTEYDTLDQAMAAASSGDTIYLGAGTYCGNSTNPTQKNSALKFSESGGTKMKSLTFVGAGTDETTWQIRALDNLTSSSDGPCDYSFDGSDSITFQNMTIVGSVYPNGNTKHSAQSYLQGFARIQNITLESCTFNGMAGYWGYKTTTFKDVTFNAPGTTASGTPNDVDYSLWTYTGESYTFESCTFNSAGKTIKVYRHGTSTNVKIDYKNCTVNSTNIKHKPVLAINDGDNTMGTYNYTINISGHNTVKGIEPNSITCSRLFGFDVAGENAGKTIVNIENEKVWENSARVGNHNHDFTTGSYDNGVAEGNANQYTDGYKDNAFTTTYGSWQWDQDENKLARTVTKTCNYCGETVETTEYKDLEMDVSRSKTATALDSSDQSTVTLSLPSAEENLVSDVVFVMDGSTSDAKEAVASSLSLLSELKKSINDASVNVCVVKFKRQAFKSEWFDLSKDYEKIKEALETKYSGGTNIHAGLLAGKEALEEHTNVPANWKHLILISDGSTYLYSKDGKWSSSRPYTRSYVLRANYNGSAGGFYDGGIWEPNTYIDINIPRPTTTADATTWKNYLQDVYDRNRDSNGDEYDYQATYENGEWKLSDDFKTQPCVKRSASNRDMAFYYADQVWQQIKDAGYNAYSIALQDTAAGQDTSDSYYFMHYLNGGTALDFSDIKNDIFYAVGAGSVVEDKMGADFDFVPGSLKLTVGGKELASKVDETDKNVVYFGDDENDLNKDAYRFKVVYDSTEDKFTWTINENVSNFAPVQLSYQVKLVNRNTAAGTYFVPTNEYAKLTPKNSAGYIGKALEFNKPEVSYTVSGGGGGGGSTTYYYFSLEKVDAQDSHTLNGAKFGLYLDGKQIATATSNSSGIATFRVDTSDYRKIDTTSKLYYQELTAPEGYVLSSDKIDIAKSDLVTSQTTAEKKAETVRNYRTSTPDQLNDADHFAYVIGYEDGTVRPNSQISRAETATIFFRLLKDSVRDGNLLTSNAYADVLNSYWANTAISTMTGLGIVQGRSSTTFDPQAPITRAEFAAICARFDTGTSSGAQTFSDISGHWAEKYIQRAAELGWIKGFEDGSFRPDTYITRAQAMTMVNRVLNRIPEETSDLLSNMNVWPDCTTNDWFYLAVQEATNSHDFKHKAGNYETWTGMKADPDWTRYEK